MSKFQKHIINPWFDMICAGKKTIHSTLDKGEFHTMKIGQLIEWQNNDTGKKRKCLVKIIRITKYISFTEMFRKEGIDKITPNYDNIRSAINEFRRFYTVQEESNYGVLAIEFESI